VRNLIRNSASCLAVFVLTVVAWSRGVSYWRRALFGEHGFESRWMLDPGYLFAIWGFDFLLSLIAGFALMLLVRGRRPMLWLAILGLGFVTLKVRFTKFWISPEAGWDVYVEDYGSYVIPLLGAFLGGLLAQRVRTARQSPRAA
jgi:hypothetical protein